MTATASQPITLPRLSIVLSLSLDRIRRRVRECPELASLCRQAGNCRFIEAEDLDRVRELLAADLDAAEPAAA